MHAWVEVGIHTYIYGRARLPRHDLVSCFQILHFRVHCWPAAKSHTQPLFSFSLLRDVEIYDDCPPIVLKELSKFTLIGLQSWSVYTNCRLFTHANSTSKASVQLSSRIEGASAQDLPKYLIQLYWKIRASKIQNCLFSLLRDSYFFFSECFFFQNYDWTDFNVNVRKTHFLYTGRDQKCSEAFPCRHIIGISSLNSSHCVIEIIEILTLCNWNNWNPNFLWVECFLAFSQWCLSLFRRKQQREIGAKLKPI